MPKVLNKYKDKITADAVYCGRGSPFGNPFVIGKDGDRDQVCDKFEIEILPHLDVSSLRGKDLICFCAPQRCHCDAILKKANMKDDKPDLFKHLNSIITTKEYLDPKDYPHIFVMIALSQHMDCILFAQEINRRYGIPPARQYDYFFHAVPQAKRYGGKWSKKDKTRQDDIDLISKYYNINNLHAKQYLKILTDDQLREIKAEMETGE